MLFLAILSFYIHNWYIYFLPSTTTSNIISSFIILLFTLNWKNIKRKSKSKCMLYNKFIFSSTTQNQRRCNIMKLYTILYTGKVLLLRCVCVGCVHPYIHTNHAFLPYSEGSAWHASIKLKMNTYNIMNHFMKCTTHYTTYSKHTIRPFTNSCALVRRDKILY